MLSPNMGKSGKRKKKKKSSAIDVLNFGGDNNKNSWWKRKSKAEKIADEMKKYKVDDEGFIVDENGNRVLDENGNPMKPEDLVKSSDGSNDDESGSDSGNADS